MSMGGVLGQRLLLDHPERLRSATLFCTTALGSGLAAGDRDEPDVELPGPDPRLLELWAEMGEPRDAEAELAWRVEHWRILSGDQLPFDADEMRLMEQRVMEHAGRSDNPAAHALADQSGLERGAELGSVTVPTLVIEAPADPINPPPHAGNLAASIGGARLVSIAGMGHAIVGSVIDPLAGATVDHVDRVAAPGSPSTQG